MRQVAAGTGLRVMRAPYVSKPLFLVLPANAPDPVAQLTNRIDVESSMAVADADAIVIFETLAINSGCNVVIDPTIPKKLLSINIQDQMAGEIINAVADACGWSLTEQMNANGKPTLIVRAKK